MSNNCLISLFPSWLQGCDGSVLLEDQPGIDSELNAPPNSGIQGLDIVDSIKAAVESSCPGVVSCADILAIASQVSVVLVNLNLNLNHWLKAVLVGSINKSIN